jgi:hypothetical protein
MNRTALTLIVGVVAGASLGVPGAIAAGKLTGKDIKNESITGKDIRDGSLKSSDFAQTYTWNVNVRSDLQNYSAQTIPAGSVVVPVRAEFSSQTCSGSPVNNPEAASFQINLVGTQAQTQLVKHPFDLIPQATGAYPAHLSVSLPDCGGQVATATLAFTFEVRVGGQGKVKAFG